MVLIFSEGRETRARSTRFRHEQGARAVIVKLHGAGPGKSVGMAGVGDIVILRGDLTG